MIRDPALISELFRSCEEELGALKGRHDLTSYLDVNRLITKSFLLSCASFYEDEITRIARQVVETGQHRTGVQAWIRTVAIDGQFYKWFNFRSARNSNAFLATFGVEFKEGMREILDRKEVRKQAERDFIELCQKRNECVHRNYAAYSMELTLNELFAKHKSAMSFIRAVELGARKWLMIVKQAD